jgi:preprotein translocase subunit SecG
MHIKHLFLIFFILIGSDVLIGFVGHYSGSVSNEFTLSSFLNYIANLTVIDLLPVFVVSIIVCFLVWRLG